MRVTFFVRVAVALIALGAVYNGACSATGTGDSTHTPRAGAAGQGQGGSSANGGASGGGNVIIGSGGSSSGGSGQNGDACADQEYAGEQKPLDMYVMFDKSGSMNEAAGSDSKWNVIKKALKDFVRSDATQGLGVGIQYFPTAVPPTCVEGEPNCECFQFLFWRLCAPVAGGACLAASYATPDVAIEALPAVASKIEASIDAHSARGGTPTTGALGGALQYARQWAAAHPERKTIVVLATDGEPSQDCANNTVATVTAVAAGGLNANPPVQTYVIGVGSSLGALNAIAAGGGGTALIIDGSTANAGQQFLDAMNRIRGAALGCDFNVPGAGSGETPNIATLNMTYTPPGAASGERVYKANGAGECSPTLGGWYFADSSNRAVRLCPKTCDTVKAQAGRIRLSMGCTPSVIIPE